MDRKQAQNSIGKWILIDKGESGRYVGILEEVIAEPRKPWRGKVKIKAILNLPDYIQSEIIDPSICYKENEIIEVVGSKLTVTDELKVTFNESLIQSVQNSLEELLNEKVYVEKKENALKRLLSSFGVDTSSVNGWINNDEVDSKKEEKVIHYTFYFNEGSYYLVDEQAQKLDLEDCPFEFEWTIDGEDIQGYYEGDGTFISKNDIEFKPKSGTEFTLNKEQFEPYYIFRKELEPPALESLEKNLQHHHVSHNDIIDCRNTLLSQLIYSKHVKTFKGVNFLTYQGKNGIVMVQHHYERKLRTESNDVIYDRFEFTTELGKRSIVTYTNDYSQ